MRRMHMRVVALLMSLIMAAGSVPASVCADETAEVAVMQLENTTEDTANFDKLIQTTADYQSLAIADLCSEAVYGDVAVAVTDDYIQVYDQAAETGEKVGKLYNNNVATVLEEEGDWCKVSSGSLVGYVQKDELVIGDAAAVKDSAETYATVVSDDTALYAQAAEDAAVVDTLSEGEKRTVTSDAENAETADQGEAAAENAASAQAEPETMSSGEETAEAAGTDLTAEGAAASDETEETAEEAAQEEKDEEWVGLEVDGETAYVPASQVTITVEYTYGETAEEEAARKEEEKAEERQAVIDYALQFVGNPYVYSGCSLTKGTDCSGFVMSVYANFGVTLPHSSYSQRSCGTQVSLDSLQPGDIICYSGHVALYIGDGKIVHAANSSTGIVVGDMYYRTPLCARRIFN